MGSAQPRGRGTYWGRRCSRGRGRYWGQLAGRGSWWGERGMSGGGAAPGRERIRPWEGAEGTQASLGEGWWWGRRSRGGAALIGVGVARGGRGAYWGQHAGGAAGVGVKGDEWGRGALSESQFPRRVPSLSDVARPVLIHSFASCSSRADSQLRLSALCRGRLCPAHLPLRGVLDKWSPLPWSVAFTHPRSFRVAIPTGVGVGSAQPRGRGTYWGRRCARGTRP